MAAGAARGMTRGFARWAHRRSVLHVGLEPAGPGKTVFWFQRLIAAVHHRGGAGPRHVAGEEDAFKAVMTERATTFWLQPVRSSRRRCYEKVLPRANKACGT